MASQYYGAGYDPGWFWDPMRSTTPIWAWNRLRVPPGGDTTPSVGADSSVDTTAAGADRTVAREVMVRIASVVITACPMASTAERTMVPVDSTAEAWADSMAEAVAADADKNNFGMHRLLG